MDEFGDSDWYAFDVPPDELPWEIEREYEWVLKEVRVKDV